MAGEKKAPRRPVGVARPRKNRNLSRKQIFEAHRKAWLVKQKKVQEEKNAEKREKVERITKTQNKRIYKSFDKVTLNAVQEGLVSVICESLGEEVSPLSVFFAATTAVTKSTEASKAQLPYLLSIISSCVPYLSQGFLLHEHKNIFALCEVVMAENLGNNLAMMKSLKLAQRVLLSFQIPSTEVLANYEKLLKPKNYTNVEAMNVFLSTYRKLLENCALCTEFADPSAPFIDGKKKVDPATVAEDAAGSTAPSTVKERGIYRLNALQQFFLKALPGFLDMCVAMLNDYPPRGMVDTIIHQVRFLFRRCFSLYICESREGRQAIDNILSGQLLSLLRPVFKDYWGAAMELLETLFTQLSYLKRVPGSTPFHCVADEQQEGKRMEGAAAPAVTQGPCLLFTDRFPAVVFLLKVLNKLRVMDDTRLNGRIERAMVAAAKGMTMQEFTQIIPFDPCVAHATELREAAGGAEDDEYDDDDDDDEQAGPSARRATKTSEQLWSTSYTLGVIRKAASHDSLPFFISHFFPFIQYASRYGREAMQANRREEYHRWSALLLQLWRVAVGFCNFPLEVDNDSFRDMAKQLVGLLHVTQSASAMHTAFFVDTAATAIHVLCDGYYRLSQIEDDDDDDDLVGGDVNGRAGNASHAAASGRVARGGDDENDDAASAAESSVSSSYSSSDDDDDRDNGDEQASDKDDDIAGSYRTLFGRLRAGKSTRRKHRQRGGVIAVRDALEDDDLYLSYTDPDWSPHRYHCISQCKAKYVCTAIFSKYSANIMPRLCNVYEQHDSTAVLQAITSFAKVCNVTVMTGILESILTVGSAIAAEQAEESGATVSGGRTKAGSAPIASKRRVVLDIACAVVPQLPAEHVQTLFSDVIEPVLMDPAPESRLLQKKAYKLLYAMFEHRVKDIVSLFPRIFGLLSVGRQHVTASGIKMRVKCLSWALDACKMFYPDQLLATIKATIGEVVIFSREQSSEVRKLTMDTLEKMQHYTTQSAGAPTNFLLHLIVAGLSGKTAMMVSGSLVCMAKIVYLTHETLAPKDLDAAVMVGFQLMGSAMQEVRSAAAVFARMIIKLSKRSPPVFAACEKALPKLLYAIALVTSQSRVSSSTRMQMRVLLEKCITRFTIEVIDPIFPLGSKNFLRYTHRMLRREEKKEERAQRKQNQNEFDQFFMSSGKGDNSLTMRTGGIEDAAGAGDDLLAAGALSGFVARHTQASVMYPGVGTQGRNFSKGAGDKDDGERDEYDQMHLEFADGKLRILTVDEKRQEVENSRRRAMADQLLRKNRGSLLTGDAINEGALAGTGRAAKRGRDDEEDFANDELVLRYGSKTSDDAVNKATAAYTTGNRGAGVVGPSENQIARLRDQKAARREIKRQRVEEDIRKGEEFKGTGSGDVKRGTMEPFAYVPLNRRFMNRRNARQALHRFQVIDNKLLKGDKAKQAADKN